MANPSEFLNEAERAARFLQLLNSKLGNQILEASVDLGHPTVRIKRESAADFFKLLKLDTQLNFNMFLSVTAVDWMDCAI